MAKTNFIRKTVMDRLFCGMVPCKSCGWMMWTDGKLYGDSRRYWCTSLKCKDYMSYEDIFKQQEDTADENKS